MVLCGFRIRTIIVETMPGEQIHAMAILWIDTSANNVFSACFPMVVLNDRQRVFQRLITEFASAKAIVTRDITDHVCSVSIVLLASDDAIPDKRI